MAKSPKPKNMPWITPRIVVEDIGDAILFYNNAFGFIKDYDIQDENGTVIYAVLTYKDDVVMLTRQGARSGTAQVPIVSGVESPITLFMYVDDVDTFFKDAIENGAAEICKPEDAFWGDRTCCLGDPDGYLWTFATKLED